MCTMKIELDKDKINTDGFATYDEMLAAVDKICSDTFFHKIGPGEYVLEKNHDSMGSLLILISRFRQQLWLLPVIKSWFVTGDDGCEIDALETYLEVNGYK